MALITADEIVRGLSIGVFGGVAGVCTLAFPGSPLWLVPAGLAVGGCALTVPEVRDELRRALPMLEQARPLLPTPRKVRQWVKTGEWSPAPLPGPLPARRQPQRVNAPPAPWLRTLNDEPDRAPHAIVFGPSGAGKTTFARAILGAREGAAVVLSPKIAADNWNGAEVVTLDDDGTYTPIAVALADLEREKRRRIGILRREGAQALAPLSVVLDEVPELTANVKDAGPFIVSLAGIGRELKMRLVCLSTSERVAALGIKGRGDTLANFVRVDLDRERRGTLNDGVSITPIGAPASWGRLAERSQLRPWHQPEPTTGATISLRPTPAPADDLLASLLEQPVSSVGHAAAAPMTVTSALGTGTGHGGVSTAIATLDTPSEGPMVRIDVHARAEAAPAPERRDPTGRRRGGLDARRRRQLAEQRRAEGRKAEQRAAYEARKAAGLSYRAAYAELGGNSEETRAWWRATPSAPKPQV